jgi:hypothetical protein
MLAMAFELVCPGCKVVISLPPLTWTATGLLTGWLAARAGKSWRVGFALGLCFCTAGVVLAALPRRSHPGGVVPHGISEPTEWAP